MRSALFILPFLAIILGAFAATVKSAFPQISWVGPVGWLIAAAPLVAWIILDLENFKKLFSRRGSKYGASSGLTVVLGLIAIIGLAYVANKPRFNKSWDLTRSGVNTLSDQSIKVLSKIRDEGQDVHLAGFFQDETVETNFRDLISLYQNKAPSLRVEYIDPRMDPTRTMAEKISSGNTVIVRSGDQETRLTTFNEEKITNALVKVLKDRVKKIYFTTGHGEGQIASEEAEGFSMVVEELKNNRYEVESLNLAEQSSVPEDADLVVIAGAKYDLRPEENTLLSAFIQRGGAVMIMVDALVPTQNINALIQEYGLTFANDLLILRPDDPRAAFLGQSTALVSEFDRYSPATRDFASKGNIMLTMINTRSIAVASENPQNFTSQGVAKSSPVIIRVRDVRSASDLENLNEGRIEEGEFPVIGIATGKIAGTRNAQDDEADSDGAAPERESRIVTVGSSQLATNIGAQRQENRDMTLNLFSFLLQDEDFISIRPRDMEKTTLEVTSAGSQMLLAFLGYIYPFLFLIFGTYAWLRRRNA
jgi:ABC-type uncharacterized transport system involved in gliding motility auxiliary subunit